MTIVLLSSCRINEIEVDTNDIRLRKKKIKILPYNTSLSTSHNACKYALFEGTNSRNRTKLTNRESTEIYKECNIETFPETK